MLMLFETMESTRNGSFFSYHCVKLLQEVVNCPI